MEELGPDRSGTLVSAQYFLIQNSCDLQGVKSMEAPRGRKSSMAISCSGVVGVWCMAVLLLGMAESVPRVQGTSCDPASLLNCYSAVTQGTPPSSQCCTEVQNANIPCLCSTYANSEPPADVTAAIALLGKCNVNQYAGDTCGRMISLSLSLSLSLSPLQICRSHFTTDDILLAELRLNV